VFNSLPRSALRSIAADDGSRNTRASQQKNNARTPNRFDSDWNPKWARPGVDDTGDMPRLSSPSGGNTEADRAPAELTEDSAPANKESKPTGSWEKHNSRELLASWLTAKGNGQLALERELARRGLTPLSKEFVRPLLSDAIADRIQLVHNIMEVAGIDAKPWLTLLADDKEADVRLEAVTVMATSKDPELIEKAWQAALHDHDPRIASLAERLRDRHSGIQRR
jgi:hypothetical protein